MKKLLIGLLIGAALVTGVGFAYAQTQPQVVPPTYLLADANGLTLGHLWEPEPGVFVSDLPGLEVCCDCAQVTVTSPGITVEPTDKPKPPATDTLTPACTGPECTPEPTPTINPTPTPVPPTIEPPTPQPTDKPKCNSGRGNGSEGDPDCDPGNSGGHNNGGD